MAVRVQREDFDIQAEVDRLAGGRTDVGAVVTKGQELAVLDPAARLQVSWIFDRPARLWHFPLEAGSGAQRLYQGVKLTGLWPVKLPSHRSWAVRWELKIEEPGGWRTP